MLRCSCNSNSCILSSSISIQLSICLSCTLIFTLPSSHSPSLSVSLPLTLPPSHSPSFSLSLPLSCSHTSPFYPWITVKLSLFLILMFFLYLHSPILPFKLPPTLPPHSSISHSLPLLLPFFLSPPMSFLSRLENKLLLHSVYDVTRTILSQAVMWRSDHESSVAWFLHVLICRQSLNGTKH